MAGNIIAFASLVLGMAAVGAIIYFVAFMFAFIITTFVSMLPYVIGFGILVVVGFSAGNYLCAGWAKLKAWWNDLAVEEAPEAA